MAMRAGALAVTFCLLVISTSRALAQAPDTIFLEELTWTELRELIQSGKTTVIVPTGGTEQNGPHMALGKHNVRVKVLSEKIARTLGNALVAPVLAYVPEGRLSPPTGHMRFVGTITTPDDVFQKLLEAAAGSFKRHGFRDVVFLGDHGSSQAGQKAAAARLNREWAATPVRAHAIEEYYRTSDVEFRQMLKTLGYREEELGTHAGLTDTSLMLAVEPRFVRAGRLRPGSGSRDGDGVAGDPTRASSELGRLGVDLIVSRTVDAIKTSIARR